MVTYDNIGNSVTLDVYARKTAANTWDVEVYNGATALTTPGPATTFTFDVTAVGKGALAAASPTAKATTVAGRARRRTGRGPQPAAA